MQKLRLEENKLPALEVEIQSEFAHDLLDTSLNS